MQALDPAVIDKLPPAMQAVIYLALLIAGVIVAVWSYLNKFKAAPAAPDKSAADFMLQAGEIADMRPVRAAAASLASIDLTLKELLKRADERAGETERHGEALEKVSEALFSIKNQMANDSSYQRGLHEGGRRIRD